MIGKDWFWVLVMGSVTCVGMVAVPTRAQAESVARNACEAEVVAALEAWSTFLASEDVTDLSAAFVQGGPQWHQLRDEVELGRGEPPVTFEVIEIVPRHREGQLATLWVEVEVRQEDHHSETFGWDFHMVGTSGGCRVWTVVEAERPVASETRPVDTKPTARTTTSTTTTPTSALSIPIQAVEAERPPVVRLPAVVAWVIVITLGGVAATGYLAPRLDRRES